MDIPVLPFNTGTRPLRAAKKKPRFEFYQQLPEGGKRDQFACTLKCERCSGADAKGGRCKRTVCIGVPLCWQHVVKYYHVKVKPSTLRNAGRGVFAQLPGPARNQDPNAIVFQRGQNILPYRGDVITEAERGRRYAQATAVYAVTNEDGDYIDGACRRGIGTLINHNDDAASVNVELVVEPDNTITIAATKDIKNGEELFLNYGRTYVLNQAGYGYRTVNSAPKKPNFYLLPEGQIIEPNPLEDDDYVPPDFNNDNYNVYNAPTPDIDEVYTAPTPEPPPVILDEEDEILRDLEKRDRKLSKKKKKKPKKKKKRVEEVEEEEIPLAGPPRFDVHDPNEIPLDSEEETEPEPVFELRPEEQPVFEFEDLIDNPADSNLLGEENLQTTQLTIANEGVPTDQPEETHPWDYPERDITFPNGINLNVYVIDNMDSFYKLITTFNGALYQAQTLLYYPLVL